jgi:uncharacterized protein (DUF169 family)
MKKSDVKKYGAFIEALGKGSAPLVAYYSDERPPVWTGPKGGFFIDIKKPGDITAFLARAGNIEAEKQKEFRCMFRFLAETRKKHIPSVFDAENFGCPGCRFYLGFIERLPSFNHFFVSNGFPGVYNGERYFPSHASSRRRAEELSGIRQKGRYVIFESIERMSFHVDPEVVIFFGNPEDIAGIATLVSFVTDDAHSVISPFASGCASIFSWPVKLAQANESKAVLGVFDPAARPWMSLGEMTLGMPYGLFLQLLGSFKKSFLYADKIASGIIRDAIPNWPNIRKRSRTLSGRMKKTNNR